MITIINDQSGRERGNYTDIGNRIELHDRAGKLLGYYDKVRDKTYSSSGVYIGNGNQLGILLKY